MYVWYERMPALLTLENKQFRFNIFFPLLLLFVFQLFVFQLFAPILSADYLRDRGRKTLPFQPHSPRSSTLPYPTLPYLRNR